MDERWVMASRSSGTHAASASAAANFDLDSASSCLALASAPDKELMTEFVVDAITDEATELIVAEAYI